jgi:predicted SAM-dependent methyltransferase
MVGLELLKEVLPKGAPIVLRIATGRLSRALFPRPRPPAPELYLHLGCGSVDHPRFVNVDGFPYPHVHHVRPLDDLSPFADGSAALVYASHCLEHFPRADVPRVLAEWRRVLRPGGVLRLSVPDFDRLLAIYAEHDHDLSTIHEVLMGGQHNHFDFHKVAFTRRSLGALLEQAGLRDVRAWTPGSDELTTFPDWSAREVPINGKSHAISLNLEATR